MISKFHSCCVVGACISVQGSFARKSQLSLFLYQYKPQIPSNSCFGVMYGSSFTSGLRSRIFLEVVWACKYAKPSSSEIPSKFCPEVARKLAMASIFRFIIGWRPDRGLCIFPWNSSQNPRPEHVQPPSNTDFLGFWRNNSPTSCSCS